VSTAVVDLGGTYVRSAIVSREGEPLRGRVQQRTDHAQGSDGVIAQIGRVLRESVASVGCGWEDIENLIVSTPGPVTPQTGIVFSPPNMLGWNDVPLRSKLFELLHVPTVLVNDANAAALGEFYFGAGSGTRNMVYITVSTGIGGGVIVEGQLLSGPSGTAGEIGHMTIDRTGPQCKCGNVGCLEAIASGTAIASRFHAAVAGVESHEPAASVDTSRATAADVVRGAYAGDEPARSIFLDAAEAIGVGVVNCLHLFNPDVVVIGGGVSNAGPILFDTIDRIVGARAMPVPRQAAIVMKAVLGDDAGLMGAVAMALGRTPSASTELSGVDPKEPVGHGCADARPE
jgi:glucokinase